MTKLLASIGRSTRRPRTSFGLAAIGATLAMRCAAGAPAGPPLEVVLAVDDQTFEFLADCQELGPGEAQCSFDVFDVGLSVSGQFSIRFDPGTTCDRVGLFGSVVFSIHEPAAKTFFLELRLPLSVGTPEGTVAAGSVAGSVVCDVGGGTVSSVGGAAIFEALAGEQPVLVAFEDTAVALPGTGAAVIGSASVAPGSTPLPGTVGTIVLRHRLTLTGGDRACFSSVAALSAPRSGDLDGDGQVDGADLGLLLAEWGKGRSQCGPADLDGDGDVDGADLGLLLAGWTD